MKTWKLAFLEPGGSASRPPGFTAILPSHMAGKVKSKSKSRSGTLRAAPAHGLAPLVGARVASLRCPILRCGQPYFTTTIEPDKSLAN
jgi:hypothetical protein